VSRTMTFVTLSAVTRLSNIGNWVGVSSGGSAGNQVSKNLATMSGKGNQDSRARIGEIFVVEAVQ